MKGVAHFSVTGEFVTRIARNLWAEGEHAKAIRLLVNGVQGFAECMALDVVSGRKKLVGTNDLKLVKDSAKTDDRGLVLPKSASDAFTQNRADLTAAKREANEIAAAASQRFDDVEDAIMDDADRISVNRTAEERIAEHWERVGDAMGLTSKPEPTTEFEKWDAGWLSPGGKFYGCKYRGHIGLAEHLGSSEPQLEDGGWIKLQTDIWIHPWLYSERLGGHITQQQLDTLFEWHQKKGKKLSGWMEAE